MSRNCSRAARHVLRDLRDKSGISRDRASAHLRADPSKISRMELGHVAVKESDLTKLLTLYGVEQPCDRTPLLDLARRLHERQWWQDYGDLAGWFCSYLVFESIAERIRSYEVRFIPGLLQTQAYAEALMRARYTTEPEIRRRVDVRMHRQRMLLKQRSPLLWAVIDEAALREGIGTRQVMRDQIEFLRHATRHPNIQLQILDSGKGGHVGVGNSFSMLRLPLRSLPDVVYLEQIESAVFLGSPDDSDPYELAMNRLSLAAGKPTETVGKLERALRDGRA